MDWSCLVGLRQQKAQHQSLLHLVPGVEGLVVVGPALGHESRLVAEARYPGSCAGMVRVHEAGRGRCGHVAVVVVMVVVWLSRCRCGGHWGPRGVGAKCGPHVRCWRCCLVSITWEPSFTYV
jgi:hypothetical protein